MPRKGRGVDKRTIKKSKENRGHLKIVYDSKASESPRPFVLMSKVKEVLPLPIIASRN